MPRGDPIVEFQTSQAKDLQTIFDTLRGLIPDVNIHFIPDTSTENTPGILLLALDTSHVAMVHLSLPAEKIRRADKFVCTRQCTAGVNVDVFWKCLKTISAQDMLCVTLYAGDPDNLYVRAETPSSGKRREFTIRLLEIDEPPLDIPNVDFGCVWTMNAGEFQKLCRDMACVDPEAITVQSTGTEIVWHGKGTDAEMTVAFRAHTEDARGIVFEEGRKDEVSVTYPLRYLTMFTRATPLCADVRAHLKKGHPIILEYEVPALGALRFCLAPTITDDDSMSDTPKGAPDDDYF